MASAGVMNPSESTQLALPFEGAMAAIQSLTARRSYSVHPETIYTQTEDGWSLAIHHWQGQARERRHPIVLLHGMATNRVNLHADAAHSLALMAAEHGFDVYVGEVRGAGLSRPPKGGNPQYEWGFGEYSTLDTPAIVKAVIERSGAQAIHAVGHSMGGMLLSALAVERPEIFRSLTTVGTPFLKGLKLKSRERQLLRFAQKFQPEEAGVRVPLKRLVGAAGNLAAVGAWFVNGTVLNKANMDSSVINLMAQEAIDDIPLRVFSELGDRIYCEEEYLGPYGFEDKLSAIELPMMVISGSADQIAPPKSVFRSVSKVSSSEIRYREMGRRFGDSIDYGHIDLLVGRDAPREVFPLMLRFIAEQDLPMG